MPAFDATLAALVWIGTAAFAMSGALAASRKRLDPVGFILVAAVTALGGGTTRDLLLGRPVAWLGDPGAVALTAAVALLVFALASRIERRQAPLEWADAVGLSVFAVIGAEAATRDGASPWVAILMGTMTASFGGLLRDVICGEVPLVLRREIYATAAALGAAAFIGAEAAGVRRELAVGAGVAAAFLLRAVALRRGWSLPAYGARGRD